MTRAKFIEELQKVLVETILENKGKSVVLDFGDKDNDDKVGITYLISF